MNTMMGVGCTVVLFKFWMQKQRAWMQAEQEIVKAELQLLKAQVHPHFLFNTLNNIYAFALEKSPKTPELVLKLSSLLSYMIYDCREPEVVLEKEIRVMNDYIDLERVRYGNRIDISVETGGDLEGKMISPLLMLPLLENAFKHGTSQQVEKPWMRFELLVKGHDLRCKIVNSKNPSSTSRDNGIGIANVHKRLELLYPNRHDLKISNEEDFFVASLWIHLDPSLPIPVPGPIDSPISQQKATT
jgi:LytS/YehU family sensor histidine kinase